MKNFPIFWISLNSAWRPSCPYAFLNMIACCCTGNKLYSCRFNLISLFCSEHTGKHLWYYPVKTENKMMFLHLMDFLFIFLSMVVVKLTVLVLLLKRSQYWCIHSEIFTVVWSTVSIAHCLRCETDLKIVGKYSINVAMWRKGMNQMWTVDKAKIH